jgi:uroporphyrinogen-III synthase
MQRMDSQPLKGRVIAIPETREVEIFASMLERRGATVVRCPMVAIRDAPDPAPVLEWSRKFARGACDDLILLTGEGLRRILSCIERNEPALKDTFVQALGPGHHQVEQGSNISCSATSPRTGLADRSSATKSLST